MMMNGIIKHKAFLTALFILIISSCAKIVPPAGGPKDTAPPQVVKSLPPPGTLFFTGSNISVTFNEYIVFDKLNEKFMISPPMTVKPEITLKGKTMRIEFREKLRDSSTYTLYFQDAIRDLNEGNPLVNYQYVFSTGAYLDSLSVTGNVLLAENLNPEKNVLVMLHKELADSAPRRMIPDYITLAGEDGYFRINNVGAGRYRLYSLIDNNNNKRYDLQDEAFAFYGEVIDVDPDSDYITPQSDSLMKAEKADTSKPERVEEGRYRLFLFTAPMKKYYLTSSSRNMPYQLVYTLSRRPDTLGFEFIAGGEKGFLTERSTGGDTLTIWLTDSLLWKKQELTTLIKYPFTDSTGKIVYRTDTIPMRYFAAKPVRGGREPKNSYKVSVNLTGGTLKPGQTIFFDSQLPFRLPDTSKIKLYMVEKEKKTDVPYNLVSDTASLHRYFLRAALREEMKYLLITDRGAFLSIYGDMSDSAGYAFTVRPSTSYGHLTMDIRNGEGKMIVQLLDNTERLIAEKKTEKDGPVLFPMLERGRYRVKVIYDLDGDGRWSTGDYDLGRQPEPVSYYPDEIEVKTDWEINQEWDVTKRFEKSRNLMEGKKKLP